MAFTQAFIGALLVAWSLGASAQGQDILQLSVRAQLSESGHGQVRTLSERDVLRSGDGLQLRLQSRVDAYVYVLALGSSGKLELLQPFSRFSEDALQRGNEPRLIPNANEFLPLDDQPGQETLFAIATADPLEEVESWLHRLDGFRSSDRVGSWLRERFLRFPLWYW